MKCSHIAKEMQETGTVLWTTEKIKNVLRMSGSSDVKIEKYKEDLLDLIIYLNEGLIQASLESYHFQYDRPFPLQPYIDEEDKEIWEELYNNSRYVNIAYTRLQAWKWLRTLKIEDPEIKKQNICFDAPQSQVMVRIGDTNPNHMLESFKKGIKKYVVFPLPFTKGDAPIFIFEPTEKFEKHLQKEKEIQRETLHFFIRTQNREFHNSHNYQPVHPNTVYEINDLVEFVVGKKTLRGIFLLEFQDKKGLERAKHFFEEENYRITSEQFDDFYHVRRRAGTKMQKFQCVWKGTDIFVEKGLLIKHPVKTSKGVRFEYYTVPIRDMKSVSKYESIKIRNCLLQLIENSGIVGLKLELSTDEEDDTNASYDPTHHNLILSFINSFNLCTKRYVHEGLTPEQTMRLLFSHELGHAHPNSQYLYDAYFFETINTFNAISRGVSDKWNSVIMKRLDKEDVISYLEELHLLIEYWKKYIHLELQAEKDAFENGRPLVPQELLYLHERDSFKNYISYKEASEWKLKEYKGRLYTIKDMLRNYKKSTIIPVSNIFESFL